MRYRERERVILMNGRKTQRLALSYRLWPATLCEGGEKSLDRGLACVRVGYTAKLLIVKNASTALNTLFECWGP